MDQGEPAGSWKKAERKKGAVVHPKRHYWCGFTPQGKERWYIELSNGRIVSYLDENYQYWLRRYKFKMREEKKVAV